MIYVFDIETDNLLNKVTKIHCLSYECNNKTTTLFEKDQISNFFNNLTEEDILIGHNIILYDIPVLKKLLNVDVKAILVDTLALSWTLFPKMKEHGLEYWGNYIGIKKPFISDWSNLTKEDYKFRCETDVKINSVVWYKHILKILKELYNEDYLRYCSYLSFKMDCVREQEEIGIKLDVEKTKHYYKILSDEIDLKKNQLEKSMPKNPIKQKTIYKDSYMDENGNIFKKGELFSNPYEKYRDITVEKIVGYEEPNPNSILQIKNWLFSLGWKPENIQHKRDKKTNEITLIPQIKSKTDESEVCESIKKLFQKEPSLELLNGLFQLTHRKNIFKNFLKDSVEGRLYASSSGLTNTLRLQHKNIVNLPSVNKFYGKEIRSCLLADEGSLLCGSDLSGIEDNTKRHYIYKYDPKYVEEMSVPGYDPHLDIAVLAGFLTKEQAEEHKLYSKTKGKEGKSHTVIRQKAKNTNFSATYKVGAATLSRNADLKLKEAKQLLNIYWKRNKAILDVEESLQIKEINGQKWLLNPVSGFWYSLRNEKDKFSTLNQGTAVYVFDRFVQQIRKQGIKIAYQCHDEWLANISSTIDIKTIINTAINNINDILKLNVTIGCSFDLGHNYAECH